MHGGMKRVGLITVLITLAALALLAFLPARVVPEVRLVSPRPPVPGPTRAAAVSQVTSFNHTP